MDDGKIILAFCRGMVRREANKRRVKKTNKTLAIRKKAKGRQFLITAKRKAIVLIRNTAQLNKFATRMRTCAKIN